MDTCVLWALVGLTPLRAIASSGVVTRMSCACGGVMLCSSSIWRCLWCRGDTVSSSACVFVVVTVFVIAEVQLSRGAGVAVQDYIVGVP